MNELAKWQSVCRTLSSQMIFTNVIQKDFTCLHDLFLHSQKIQFSLLLLFNLCFALCFALRSTMHCLSPPSQNLLKAPNLKIKGARRSGPDGEAPNFLKDSGETPRVPQETPHDPQGIPHEPQAGCKVLQGEGLD
jgi:hypothetical protein